LTGWPTRKAQKIFMVISRFDFNLVFQVPSSCQDAQIALRLFVVSTCELHGHSRKKQLEVKSLELSVIEKLERSAIAKKGAQVG